MNSKSPAGEGAAEIDIIEILARIPHRYPFLLVDRAEEYRPHQSIVGIKCVTANEPFFQGHFPGAPVMPGVLILEALAQAGALLACLSLTPEETKQKITYLMGIDGARFRKPVVPGDRLELEVEVTKHKAAVWKQKAVAKVDGQVVAEAEFMAMIADRQS